MYVEYVYGPIWVGAPPSTATVKQKEVQDAFRR